METEPISSDIRKTIFVVDDDSAVLSTVCSILEGPYRILRANSGSAALKQAAAFDAPIHLLLTAFQMPEMTGIDLATRMCKDRPQMKVLMMSGFTDGMLVLNEGWHFLAKPFVASKLRAIAITLLNDVPPFDADRTS